MAGPTCDILHPEVGSTGTDGDAVVTGLDLGVDDRDAGRQLDVDAVGVGAVTGSRDPNSLEFDLFAAVDHNVEHLAVQ